MIQKIQKLVYRFWGGQPVPARDSRPAPSRPKGKLGSQEFNANLKQLISARGKISASKLQIISMDKIREFVEGDWNEFSEKVRIAITTTIMKRLGPKDSFTQTDDNSYIIVFDSLSKEDAELECVLIVQEVLRTLFVDRHLDDRVDIRSVAVGIDGKIDVEEVDLLNIITRLLKEEQEVVERKLSRRTDTASSVASPPPDIAFVEPDKKKTPSREDAFDFENFTKSLPRDIKFLYRPYWDVKRNVLSTYSCIPTDGVSFGYALLGEAPDPGLIPALDYLVIGRVTYELKALYEKNSRLLITCPVHINTLSDVKAWGTYRLLCERLSKSSLKRDLVFEICGIGDKVDIAKLTYCASKIKPYCRNLVIRTPLSVMNFKNFDSGIFDALCADVESFQGSEKRQMKLMDDYVESARKSQLHVYAHGLNRLSQVTASIGSGFTKIAGDAVHKPIDKPEFVFRFEAQNLLSMLTS
ncbi:MAG TPA: hypothetical protein VIF12_08320 [Micavibrio sp.]